LFNDCIDFFYEGKFSSADNLEKLNFESEAIEEND